MEDRSVISWKRTRVTSALGIEYPIIQGPLGGLSSQRLTAAVSNYGGLGSLGAHSLNPHTIKDRIDEIRSLTEKPFAINLWISMEDDDAVASDARAFQNALSHISPHLARLGATEPSFAPYKTVRFEDQVRVLIDAKVPAFSFIYGLPPKEVLDECRRLGIVLMGTATTVDEAKVLADAGVDIVVASGFEAGGHRGSFLRKAEDSLMGTISLIPQVSDAVNLPVIAAGGIADARGVVAAFALGAEAVQVGTVFLACNDSGASEVHRNALLSGKAAVTGLTRGFTGRLARAIKNELMDELNATHAQILPYPLQRHLIRSLSIAAENAQEESLLPMWSGQSAALIKSTDVESVMDSLLKDISKPLDAFLRWKQL